MPDVILLDAMMPGMDGFETCRRLKQTPAVAHVPVVFMTALTEPENVVEGFAAGGTDYVTKPVVLDVLFARLKAHLAAARASQGARAALDTAGSHLLAVDRAGTLLWSTPQAATLIGAAFPIPGGGGSLPETASAELLQAVRQGAGSTVVLAPRRGDGPLQLAYLGTVGGGEFLFRLDRPDEGIEGLRRRFGLTAREAEVLLWIGRGKSNRDIADILALSPRTVNKHLEGIYAKLGVENRASAAVLATRGPGSR